MAAWLGLSLARSHDDCDQLLGDGAATVEKGY